MREGSDGSSNAQEKIVVLRLAVWEKSEFVTRGPSKLARQPINRKTVAHNINPGEITQFVYATDLAWQLSRQIMYQLKHGLQVWAISPPFNMKVKETWDLNVSKY